MTIESLKHTNDVLSWNEYTNSLSYSVQNNYFDNGTKECIELTLEDNTKLICTKDHKILMEDGKWIDSINTLNVKIKKDLVTH